MEEVVVSDTSCFIILNKIGELELLRKVFMRVYTTPEVAFEFQKELPEWVIIRSPVNKQLQTELESKLGKGESSAIVLATEIIGCSILLDDLEGRSTAWKLGLNVSGTIGLFLKAKNAGAIPLVLPLIDKIRGTNFRYSQSLLRDALREAGE